MRQTWIGTLIAVIVLVIIFIFVFRNGGPDVSDVPTDDSNITTPTEDVELEPGDEFNIDLGDVVNNLPFVGNNSDDELLVEYTSDGFNPKTLEISAGDTVTFVSTDGSDMWVGADNHPTHTLYPGSNIQSCFDDTDDIIFDQCGTSNEFSFTFTESGSWGYHNHVRANHTGTIVVE